MKPETNAIHLAVVAAGGKDKVASAFGRQPRSLNRWWQKGAIPPEVIRPLCEMGGFRVTPDEILGFIERARADTEGAARA